MVEVNFELLSVILSIFVVGATGLLTRSIMVAGSAGVLTFGYLAIKTGNSFLLGGWFLMLFIMALSTARFISKAILGDVS